MADISALMELERKIISKELTWHQAKYWLATNLSPSDYTYWFRVFYNHYGKKINKEILEPDECI